MSSDSRFKCTSVSLESSFLSPSKDELMKQPWDTLPDPLQTLTEMITSWKKGMISNMDLLLNAKIDSMEHKLFPETSIMNLSCSSKSLNDNVKTPSKSKYAHALTDLKKIVGVGKMCGSSDKQQVSSSSITMSAVGKRQDGSTSGDPKATKKSKKQCTFCNKIGHTAKQCFKAKRSCYNCCQKGHVAADCPEAVSTLVKSGATVAELRSAQIQAKRLAQDTPQEKPELGNMMITRDKFLRERFDAKTTSIADDMDV